MIFKTKEKLIISMLLILTVVSNVSAYSETELTTMFKEEVHSLEPIKAANFLVHENIIVDRSKNPEKYNFSKTLYRQEMAGITRAMLGLEKTTECSGKFKDVSSTIPNNWACLSIEPLFERGYIAKSENYRPEDKVSKAEVLGFIIGSIYKSEYNKDYDKAKSWQENVINFAKNKKVLRTAIGDYNDPANRGFVFEIAYYVTISKKIDTSSIKTNEGEEEREREGEGKKIDTFGENLEETIDNLLEEYLK